MFESYMRYQYADPRSRGRMILSGLVAGALTMSTLTLAWAAAKMEVTRVDAPAMETLLFQLGVEVPPPPAPPPPPKGAAVVDTKDDPIDKPEAPDEPAVVPEEVIRPADSKSRQGGASRAGVPDGVIGGRTGPLPPGVGFPPRTIGDPLLPRELPAKARPPEPLEAVMARAIYTPEPDQRLLASTQAGMFDRRPCTNRTHFCVDADGRTSDVRTSRSCDDAKVDQICRDAVKRWRFKPSKVAGSAHRSCSVVTFSLVFRE